MKIGFLNKNMTLTNKEIQRLMDSPTKGERDELKDILKSFRINRIQKIWEQDELYE